MESSSKVRAICDLIVAQMKAQDISMRKLSGMAGLSESAVRDLLRKVDNPGVATLFKIADALGIPFDDLMAAGEEGDGPNNVRAWREFHGMTREQLAEQCDPPTTAAVIELVEGYGTTPSPKWLRRLAPALKTSPGFLSDINPSEADTLTMEMALAVPESRRAQVREILQTFLRDGTNG